MNVGSLKKRNAPAPPSTSSASSIYGTLPHAPRHSQNLENVDRICSSNKAPEMYSTLPHVRTANTLEGKNAFHYDNKVYERFEPIMAATQQQRYEKNFEPTEYAGQTHVMTTFGHKRSPSTESFGRNIHLGIFANSVTIFVTVN